jgi:hypothetical protein
MKFASFTEKGRANTAAALDLAKANADELGVGKVVVASTAGDTALKALELMGDRLVVVTHNAWFKPEVPDQFAADARTRLTQAGVPVVTGTLAFSGVDSGLLAEHNTYTPTALFSRLVRSIFCDGVKVCMEIVMMAVDAGHVNPGDEVIAVAGTGYGADTVCLVTAASSRAFPSLRVKAILAKPL